MVKGYDEDCIFCKIARGKIASFKVYENKDTFAFLDINPRNPGHTLVIPKKHYETILNMPENEAVSMFKVVRRVAISLGKSVNADGVTIAQSSGAAAGQAVNHVHVHIIPRMASEDPVSIEGLLPVKSVTRDKMNAIASKIRKNVPK